MLRPAACLVALLLLPGCIQQASVQVYRVHHDVRIDEAVELRGAASGGGCEAVAFGADWSLSVERGQDVSRRYVGTTVAWSAAGPTIRGLGLGGGGPREFLDSFEITGIASQEVIATLTTEGSGVWLDGLRVPEDGNVSITRSYALVDADGVGHAATDTVTVSDLGHRPIHYRAERSGCM